MQKQATIEDLEKELWLRERNNGNLIWKTSNGNIISVKDLTSDHIINIINRENSRKNLSIEIQPNVFNFY